MWNVKCKVWSVKCGVQREPFLRIREKADAALNNGLFFQLRHAASPRCHRNA